MPVKRSSWVESIPGGGDRRHLFAPEVREELSDLDAMLYEAWNLGENIMLAWTQDRAERRFLAVRHYQILEPFGNVSSTTNELTDREFINTILASSKFIGTAAFGRLRESLGSTAQIFRTPLRTQSLLTPELVNSLVTRYSVSLVREQAVMLLDAVGFSLCAPLEQVAMLNSLSCSVNSAHGQLMSKDIRCNFARSSTGDGFYIWNKSRTWDANVALYKLMILILADNAVAQRKAKRFPVPKLRAAFHIGEHYEFYQVEALNPTTFSYIVGQVTIELARIIEKALPGQILLGDFNVSMKESETGDPCTLGTPDFIERTATMLDQLAGLAVADDRIAEIRCYVTGEYTTGTGFSAERYTIRDKHGMTRSVYNAKANIHLRRSNAIFLGIQNDQLQFTREEKRSPTRLRTVSAE